MGNVIGLILKEKALCSFDTSVGGCFPRRHRLVSVTTLIFSFSARTSILAAQNSHLKIQYFFPFQALQTAKFVSCHQL